MDGLLPFQVVPQNQFYGLHIPGLGLHPETNRFSGRNGVEGMSEERVAGVMLQLVPVDIVVQPFRRGGWIFPNAGSREMESAIVVTTDIIVFIRLFTQFSSLL